MHSWFPFRLPAEFPATQNIELCLVQLQRLTCGVQPVVVQLVVVLDIVTIVVCGRLHHKLHRVAWASSKRSNVLALIATPDISSSRAFFICLKVSKQFSPTIRFALHRA